MGVGYYILHLTAKNNVGEIKIRDVRRKEKYVVDDEYLNGYARLCGANATAVYNSLCRHAGFHTQEAFPSIDKIAEQHGFGSNNTVIKAIKKLEEWGIIVVKREKNEKTKRQEKNVYLLADKSEWKPKPSALNELGAGGILSTEPGAFNEPDPGALRALEGNKDIKVTKIKENAAKQSFAGTLHPFIDSFKEVNPNYELFYRNNTERHAADRLLCKFGEEKMLGLMEKLPSIIIKPYAPRITTPYELEKNMGKLIVFLKQEQTKNQKTQIVNL